MEQFDQLLTCCVCLDRYRNPKLLPCQHSFCMEPCMEGLVDYVRRQVKCPECRAEHRIPYQGVQHFPTNVTLQRFLELHIDLTGELPDPTSNQIMERCQVCSEKAYCNICAHCEKKVCPDCKEAHLDVVKREITRLSSQVRRVMHRLEDAVNAAAKNLSSLKGTSSHVLEEVDDLCRRFTKAIKDKGDSLRTELDNFVSSELTTLNNYKTNLETEISNINSNCDVVEKYVLAENSTMTWDDQELMDTKDLLVKTMDFIRNFEYEPGDRRIRFTSNQDPSTIVVGLTNFGDLVFPGAVFTQHQPPAQQPQFSPSTGIMRSKSDHRLVQQYRDMDEAEQQNSSTRSKYSKYGSNNDGDDRKFRSRFTRRLLAPEDDDSRVRFNESGSGMGGSGGGGGSDQTPAARTQARVLEIEDSMKGPLSGIARLLDSTRVLEKMVELDSPKKKTPSAPAVPTVPVSVQQQMQQMQKQLLLQQQQQQQAQQQIVQQVQLQQQQQQQQQQPTTHPWRQSSQEKSSSQKSTPAPPLPRKQSTEKSRSESESSSEQSGSSSSTSSSSHKSVNTGANFTTDEVKQKFLKGNTPTQKQPTSTSQSSAVSSSPSTGTTGSGGGAGGGNKFRRNVTPLASQAKVNKADDSDSSSEESEEESSSSEDDDDVPTPAPPSNATSKMEKTDIGPLLARSANARDRETPSSTTSTARSRIAARLSSDEPPITSTTSSGRTRVVDEPISPRSRDPPMLERRVSRDDGPGPAYSAYRSRQQKSPPERTYGTSTSSGAGSASSRYGSSSTTSPYDYGGLSRSRTGTALYEPESSSSRLQSKYLNRSRHNLGGSMDQADEHIRPSGNPYYTGRSSYLAKHMAGSSTQQQDQQRKSSSREKSRESKAKILSRSKSSHELAPGEIEGKAENDDTQSSLSSWARYLKSKYGKTTNKDGPDSSTGQSGGGSGSGGVSGGGSTIGNASDSSLNSGGSPGTGLYGGMSSVGSGLNNNVGRKSSSPQKLNSTASQYSGKKRMIFKFGNRGSDPGYFTWPRGIACGPDGNIVVADSSNHRIQVFDQQGNFVKEFGSYGASDSEFDCLAGVAVNRIGQFIVSDRYNHRIQVFDPSGRFLRSFGSQGSTDGKFNYPWGVTTDALGFIYVCDKENHRVQVFQSDGTFVGKFGVGELEHPHYIAVTCTNKVVVSDTGHHRVFIFDVNGKILGSIGAEGIEHSFFKLPRGVAVDEQGYIFVGDSGNNRIQIFSPDGVHIRSFGGWGSGDGEFKGMEGIAVNSNGNILVCDRENHRIQVF